MVGNFAFIDSQNLNLGVKSDGWSLDFKKFRLYLKNKYKVSRAFLFIGFIKGNEKLYSDLDRYGYELVYKPTLGYQKDGRYTIKGNVDVELVINVMLLMDSFQKAVIVSGDGDFYSLIDLLFKRDKLEKVIVPNYRYSSLLKKYISSDYIQPLRPFRNVLEEKKRGIHGRSKP